MKRIIIAGSRLFNNYRLLKKELDEYIVTLDTIDDIEIVSGHCRGTDQLGERYARSHGFKIKYFPAEWNKYGRSARPMRNRAMVQYAKDDDGFLFLFWNGKSKGSKSMLHEASMIELPYKIVFIDE